MNDEQNKKQDESSKTSDEGTSQKNPDKKTRVKGSHRKGTPPKLKWI